MKLFFTLFMAILLLGSSSDLQAGDGHFVRVSEKNRAYFELDNGTPYIPIGLNLCSFGKDPDKGMQKLEFYFKSLSENGGNYARIWLSCPLFEIEKDAPGNFDPQALARVEKMLQLAEKYNIHLKLCFEHFRNLGEKEPSWCRKAFYRSETMKTIKDYVNSETGRSYFLNRCRQFEKFRDNPYVFGWEIWNEMNCLPDFIPFTKFVLPKLHEMFPRQMVMQSLGSYDYAPVFDSYKTINTMPGNDVAQIHRYLDPGASLAACKGPMDLLCADAVAIMKKIDPRRPIMLAETGAVEKNHTGPSKLYPLDREGLLLHDTLFVPFFCGTAGTGHIWHWNDYVEKNNLWYHFSRFNRAIQGVNPLEENFRPSVKDQNDLRLYEIRGDKTTLIFIRDQKTNWQTELINKVPAPVRNKVVIDLGDSVSGKIKTVRCYDPWNDTEVTLEVKDHKITIPKFRRSVVVRIVY